MPVGDASGRGCELVGVFRVDSALDRVAFDMDIALDKRQALASRNHDLGSHNVNARDPFRHRMLDLDAGIHLDKIKLAVFVEKLKGSRAAVTELLDGGHTAFANSLDQFARNAGCRSFLDDFLVAPLHGAIALTQPDRVFVLVSQNLDFNVPGILQEFLHVNLRVAKSRASFGLGGLHRVEQRRFRVYHAHAATAAAARRLDDDGVANLFGNTLDEGRVGGQRALGTGHAGHTCLQHRLLGRDLVAQQANRLWRRANELETAFFDPLGKIGVLAQETVAGMNRLGVRHLSGRNNGRHVEVA